MLLGASFGCLIVGHFIEDCGVSLRFAAAGFIMDLVAIVPFGIAWLRGEHWMPLQRAHLVAESYNERF